LKYSEELFLKNKDN